MKKVLIILIVFTIVQTTVAQQINNVFSFNSETKHSMTLNLEFDPALVWGITYNRSFDIRIGEFERRLVSQLGWKTFKFNYNDLNLNLQTTILNEDHSFNVIANFGAENKYLENKVHQANIYNWIASIMPGYYADKWYIGTEIMYKWLYGAKYDHTEFYKEIHPEVRDGWYDYQNAYVNLSLNLGAKLSKNLDVDLRAGYRFTHDFKSYRPYLIPYFGDLAFNFRF